MEALTCLHSNAGGQHQLDLNQPLWRCKHEGSNNLSGTEDQERQSKADLACYQRLILLHAWAFVIAKLICQLELNRCLPSFPLHVLLSLALCAHRQLLYYRDKPSIPNRRGLLTMIARTSSLECSLKRVNNFWNCATRTFCKHAGSVFNGVSKLCFRSRHAASP